MNEVKKIQEERKDDYGDALESFKNIADMWNPYLSRRTQLNVELDETDVAQMMVLFKISRNAYKRKEDNFIDAEAYMNFARNF